MNETQPIKNDFEALEKFCWDFIKVLKNTCDNVLETIIKPLYDRCLLVASAENPKWYYYYKNAKKKRIRKKYRSLLQNKFLLLFEKEKSENKKSPRQSRGVLKISP
jgi:hypothetical protein